MPSGEYVMAPLSTESGMKIPTLVAGSGEHAATSPATSNSVFRRFAHEGRYCQRTRAYAARRTAEGLSKPEIIRCLKRYHGGEGPPAGQAHPELVVVVGRGDPVGENVERPLPGRHLRSGRDGAGVADLGARSGRCHSRCNDRQHDAGHCDRREPHQSS